MNRFWVTGNSKKVLFPGKSVFIFLRDGNPVPRTVQMTFLQLIRLVHNESSLIYNIFEDEKDLEASLNRLKH